MTPGDHKSAAQALLNAEKQRARNNHLSPKYPEMKIEDAYTIQNQILMAKQAAGCSVIRWKIGLTSKAIQDALNIDIPDSGVLFDDMLFDHNEHVPQDRFIQPRVEAEIACVFKSPIGSDRLTAKDVIEAAYYVCPSLKILKHASADMILKAE